MGINHYTIGREYWVLGEYGCKLKPRLQRTVTDVICWSMSEGIDHPVKAYLLALYMDLLIIMTKYTLILAPLEVFAKRTFLGQGPGLQLSRVLSK